MYDLMIKTAVVLLTWLLIVLAWKLKRLDKPLSWIWLAVALLANIAVGVLW